MFKNEVQIEETPVRTDSLPTNQSEPSDSLLTLVPLPLTTPTRTSTNELQLFDIEETSIFATSVTNDAKEMKPLEPLVSDMDTTPGGSAGATPGGPMGTTPNSAMDTTSTPSGPAGTTRGGPMGTTSGSPAGATPGGPMGTTPGSPAGATPGGPMGTTLGSPAGATPGGPVGTTPSSPMDTTSTPSGPAGTIRGGPVGSPSRLHIALRLNQSDSTPSDNSADSLLNKLDFSSPQTARVSTVVKELSERISKGDSSTHWFHKILLLDHIDHVHQKMLKCLDEIDLQMEG